MGHGMSIILWLHHRSGPLTKDKTSYLRILHIYSRNEYDVFHTEPQPLEELSTFFCFRRSFALTAETGTHCDPVCLTPNRHASCAVLTSEPNPRTCETTSALAFRAFRGVRLGRAMLAQNILGIISEKLANGGKKVVRYAAFVGRWRMIAYPISWFFFRTEKSRLPEVKLGFDTEGPNTTISH